MDLLFYWSTVALNMRRHKSFYHNENQTKFWLTDGQTMRNFDFWTQHTETPDVWGKNNVRGRGALIGDFTVRGRPESSSFSSMIITIITL